MAYWEIIYGTVEHNLFDGPGHNHRTYQAPPLEGWFTGVDCADNDHACSEQCIDHLLEQNGFDALAIPATGHGVCYTDHAGDVAVHVKLTDTGWCDATVYPLESPSEAQLPISCSYCARPMFDEDGTKVDTDD